MSSRQSVLDHFISIMDEIWRYDQLLELDLSEDKLKSSVVYSLDATEFHQFLKPQRAVPSLGYASDATSEVSNLILYETLNRYIFTQLDSKLTVMPAHLSELGLLFDDPTLPRRAQLMDLISEQEKLPAKVPDELKRLDKTLRSLVKRGSATQEMKKVITSSSKTIIPHLYLFKNRNRNRYFDIRHLFQTGRIASFSNIFDDRSELRPNREIFDFCFKIFSAKRPGKDSSNSSDAFCFAFAHAINSTADAKSPSLRLISSAPSMFEVEDELSKAIGGEGYIRIVRHPVNFLPLLMARQSGLSVQNILSERSSLYNLLKDISPSPTVGSFLHEFKSIRVLKRAKEFVAKTRSLNQLLVLDSLFDFSDEMSSKSDGAKKEILEFAKFLGSNADIQPNVEKLIGEVIHEVEGAALLTGTEMLADTKGFGSQTYSLSEFDSESREEEKKEKFAEGQSSRLSRPVFHEAENRISLITILFYSQKIQKIIFGGDRYHINYRSLVTQLMDLKSSSYESRLGLAYVFALRQRWSWALKFSRYAINSQKRNSQSVAKHEAYYLIAVARRYCLDERTMQAKEIQRDLISCVRELRRAQEILSSSKKSDAERLDIRILSELALCLHLIMLQGSEVEEDLALFQSAGETPLAMWKYALTLEPNAIEELLIINRILYYFADDLEGRGEFSSYWSRFISLGMIVTEGDLKRLPDNIQDTIIQTCSVKSGLLDSKVVASLMAVQKEGAQLGVARHDHDSFKTRLVH